MPLINRVVIALTTTDHAQNSRSRLLTEFDQRPNHSERAQRPRKSRNRLWIIQPGDDVLDAGNKFRILDGI